MDEGASGLAGVDLYWILLGAGDHIVRVSGKLYEALKGISERRPRTDLYHSALEIILPGDRSIIESAPIPDLRGSERGVAAEGPVGMRWLGRFRLFRYEIRSWRGGSIPDVRYAVASPVRATTDVECAERVIELVPRVPTPVWGRDELATGDMWNSKLLGLVAPRASGHRDRRATTTGRRPSSGLGSRTHPRSAPSEAQAFVNEMPRGMRPLCQTVSDLLWVLAVLTCGYSSDRSAFSEVRRF
jgi:hypothetical protein